MGMLFVGVFFTLYGFGFLSPKPGADSKVDEFHKQWGVYFRIMGPLGIAYGLYQVLTKGVVGSLWRGSEGPGRDGSEQQSLTQ
jgi:hypothetical protein